MFYDCFMIYDCNDETHLHENKLSCASKRQSAQMNAPPSSAAAAKQRTVRGAASVTPNVMQSRPSSSPTRTSSKVRSTRTTKGSKPRTAKITSPNDHTKTKIIVGVVCAVLLLAGSIAALWYTLTRGSRNDPPNIVPAPTTITPSDIGFKGTCPFDTNNGLFCTIFPWTAPLVADCGVFDPSQVDDTCEYSCSATLSTWLQVGLWPDQPTVGLTRPPNASDGTPTPDPGHNEACALSDVLATYAASPGTIMPNGTSNSDLDGASRLFGSMARCISTSYLCG
jgi:hypothetical protein